MFEKLLIWREGLVLSQRDEHVQAPRRCNWVPCRLGLCRLSMAADSAAGCLESESNRGRASPPDKLQAGLETFAEESEQQASVWTPVRGSEQRSEPHCTVLDTCKNG